MSFVPQYTTHLLNVGCQLHPFLWLRVHRLISYAAWESDWYLEFCQRIYGSNGIYQYIRRVYMIIWEIIFIIFQYQIIIRKAQYLSNRLESKTPANDHINSSTPLWQNSSQTKWKDKWWPESLYKYRTKNYPSSYKKK